MKKSVLSIPGFRNLWVGQLISQFGDHLYSLVFLWMIMEATNDPKSVGVVAAFGAMPYVLFSLYAGVIADRANRRWVLVWSDVVSALLVLALTLYLLLGDIPHLALICVIAFCLGTANVFAAPARAAAIPNLVPEDRLIEANSWNSASQSLMPIASYAVSALVLKALFALSQLFAYVLTFLVNTITFVISAFFMWKLPDLQPERSDDEKHVWHEAVEGLRFVWGYGALRAIILSLIGSQFFIAPFMVAYVVIAQERFEGTPALLAFLELGFFAGMLLGSVIVPKLKIKRAGLAFVIAMTLAACTIMPMGYLQSPTPFWILNFVCGIFIPIASIPLNTFIQIITPDHFRGRVNSALSMMVTITMPVGTALSGTMIAMLGLESTFLVMGIGFGVCGLLAATSRDLRVARIDLPGAESPSVEAQV